MSSKAQADALGRVLENTGLFQTVSANFKADQIAVMGRVLALMPQWLQFVKKLKVAEALLVGPTGMIKVMQDYFVKEVPVAPEYPDGRKVVFAWVVTVNATNFTAVLQNIERLQRGENLLALSPPSLSVGAIPVVATNVVRTTKTDANGKQYVVEEQDVPLPGVAPGTDRNVPKAGSRKGAMGVR